eukprot:1248129-Prymnesium_polylepis.1
MCGGSSATAFGARTLGTGQHCHGRSGLALRGGHLLSSAATAQSLACWASRRRPVPLAIR